MQVTRGRLLRSAVLGGGIMAALYRVAAGPVVQETTATMELAVTIALVFALVWSLGAIAVIGLSMRVNDVTTKQRLRKNALVGGSSPILVGFLIWVTGIPLPL